MDWDYLIVKNPSKEERIRIRTAVKMNDGYCPTKKVRTPDTKCPCKEYREHDDCICGFFLKIPCIEVTEGA